jgi:hypothetical protein
VLALFYVDDGLVAARTVEEADAPLDLVDAIFEIRKLGKPGDFCASRSSAIGKLAPAPSHRRQRRTCSPLQMGCRGHAGQC